MKMELVIKNIVNEIVKNINPEMIILFGSYAKGDYNNESDIDLLIVENTNLTIPERIYQIRKILVNYKIPKDIIVKTPAEYGKYKNIKNTLDYEIDKSGKVIYERAR